MPTFLNSNKNLFTFLFFLIFFLTGIYIFQDYGISIDEDNTRILGFLSLEHIFNIFFPESVSKINEIISIDSDAHSGYPTSGIVFDLPMAFLEFIFQIEDSRQYYLLRHFFNFFIFFVSVFLFFQLIKKRYNSWSLACVGTMFLLISPRIFANSFFNNKDIVFMSLFIIGLYTAINFLEKKNIKSVIIFSIVSSLLVNLRIFGLILPLLIFLFYTINILHDKNSKKEIIKPLLLLLILTPFFIILFWPYLWENPIEHFLYVIKSSSSHSLGIYNYYLGQHFFSTNPPWHYSLVWISITTPLFYIILFPFGFIFILQRTIKRWLKTENNNSFIYFWRGNKELQDLIFLLTFLIPILVSIYFGSISYDGWRHLYFIYPSFLLISILGLHLIKVIFFRRKNNYLYILCIILITPTAFWMYKNHPFQYVYFNLLAGKNFNEKFEMDYSGVSNKNVLEYIIAIEDKKVRIHNLSTTDLNLSKKILKKEMRERITVVGDIKNADYITNNYRDWNGKTEPAKFVIPKNFKILYEIKVDDVPINSIYKKK